MFTTTKAVGRDNKLTAIKCYLESRQNNSKAISLEPTGYIYYQKSVIYLGVSADGKLLCASVDTCCYGCLESKCPYSIDGLLAITLTPKIAENIEKIFIRKGEDGLLHLLHGHSYYIQVQGEMAVIKVEWCDFVVYSNGEVLVDRIVADQDSQ